MQPLVIGSKQKSEQHPTRNLLEARNKRRSRTHPVSACRVCVEGLFLSVMGFL